MVIECFFRTATDARFALRDFKREGLEPGVVQPAPANNGRPWLIEVRPRVGMTDRYAQPQLLALVQRIVGRHNGTTEQVDRN